MKNLELENYGVQEMRTGEMSETDGGWFWQVEIAVGLVVYEIYDGLSRKCPQK